MLPTLRRNFRNPFDELQREIDGVFNRMWADLGEETNGATGWGSYPVDIHENDDTVVIEADLPGFKRDEIDVTFEQGVLTISAERRTSQENKGEPRLHERRYTRVTRSFRLPQSVDENKVDAKLQDGVLTLTLHKREEVKPRRIEVK